MDWKFWACYLAVETSKPPPSRTFFEDWPNVDVLGHLDVVYKVNHQTWIDTSPQLDQKLLSSL